MSITTRNQLLGQIQTCLNQLRDNDAIADSLAAQQSHDRMAEIMVQQQSRIEELEKLQAFKSWIHNYLDNKGIPTHPDGPHSAEGCRIGDRMDYVFTKIAALEPAAVEAAGKIRECLRRRLEGEAFGWIDTLNTVADGLAAQPSEPAAVKPEISQRVAKALAWDEMMADFANRGIAMVGRDETLIDVAHRVVTGVMQGLPKSDAEQPVADSLAKQPSKQEITNGPTSTQATTGTEAITSIDPQSAIGSAKLIAHQYSDVMPWAIANGFVPVDEGPATDEQLLLFVLQKIEAAAVSDWEEAAKVCDRLAKEWGDARSGIPNRNLQAAAAEIRKLPPAVGKNRKPMNVVFKDGKFWSCYWGEGELDPKFQVVEGVLFYPDPPAPAPAPDRRCGGRLYKS